MREKRSKRRGKESGDIREEAEEKGTGKREERRKGRKQMGKVDML